jgi:peptidoglycan-associated lipoprotein
MNYFGRCARCLFPALVLFLVAAAPACHKNTGATQIPPPASTRNTSVDTAVSGPVSVSITATPPSIRSGQSVTLSWEAKNADSLAIDGGIGSVGLTGSRVLVLKSSTTFTATAYGASGTVTASARVSVTGPAEDTSGDLIVSGVAPSATVEALFDRGVRDVFFEYDKYNLSPESTDALYSNANFLRQYPNLQIVIEGHCDERGTAEYNLALGDRRAKVTKDFLVGLGIRAERISTISYGEERPFDPGHAEEAWVKNRRAHFTLARP